MIFVASRLPHVFKPKSASKQQNEQLKNKYHINGFPTVIVLDPNENVLGKTGYKAGGAKAYADHLSNIIRK